MVTFMQPKLCTIPLLLSVLSILTACGESEEAKRISMPVQLNTDGITQITTSLGYKVTLTTFRTAIRDLELTTGGEVHGAETSSLTPALRGLFIGQAYAHPGHYAGGAVVGELPGRFIIDWIAKTPAKLGDATVLAGEQYNGLNFYFTTATADDGLTSADPLLTHTAEVKGSAVSADGLKTITFDVLIDQDSGRQVVGAPFDAKIPDENPNPAQLQFLLYDTITQQSLFDGVDFVTLDDDGDGQVTFLPDTDPYNRIRRAMQSHDFYFVKY
jgi:hypothetical protein